jgi:hypothetical protein
MTEGLKSLVFFKERIMTKRCLMTICFALLTVSAAMAQETPVTKKADKGPSLEVTMNFIQEKLRAKAKAPFHGALTNAEANPTNCQLTLLGDDPNEAIELVKFAEIEKIEVFQRVNEDNAPINLFDLMIHTTSQTAIKRYFRKEFRKGSLKVFTARGQAELRFEDQDMANRVGQAMLHAVELCGGGSQPEPF